MQDHIIHIAFTALPFLIILFLLLRNISVTNLQKLVVITLVLFFFLHAGPFTQVFAYHHLQNSTEHHPCCMHQISTAVGLFMLIVATVTVLQLLIAKPLIYKPSYAFSYLTRAPPTFI